MTRVRHFGAATLGHVVGPSVPRLNPYDHEGPWVPVRFDDGLESNVPTSQLEVWTVFGWMEMRA